MKCPACREKRLKAELLEKDLTAYGCASCEGVWIPALQYWEWVQSRDEDEKSRLSVAEISPPIEAVGQAKICPECGHLLRRYKVWPNVTFYLDRCGNCMGVWFDQNEWAYLKAKGQHDEVHEFFGALWQEELREEERREKVERMYQERFGRTDYTKIKRLREWLWNHPQQGALIAYLTDKDPYRL